VVRLVHRRLGRASMPSWSAKAVLIFRRFYENRILPRIVERRAEAMSRGRERHVLEPCFGPKLSRFLDRGVAKRSGSPGSLRALA
jgi:hypothetical protein